MADIKKLLDKRITGRIFLLQTGAVLVLLGTLLSLNTFAAQPVKTVKGAMGPTGLTGATGLQGPAGPAGATGPRGAAGPAGAAAGSVSGSPVTYHLQIADLEDSFIQIPTSDLSIDGPLASGDLAGRAPLYDAHNVKVGTCSAAFLSMQTNDGIFTNGSNTLSTNSGLIVSWVTPAKLPNLELDSIVHSMVAESTVAVTTKTGSSSYFGKKFDLVVSSHSNKIYFKFTPIH